MYHFVYAQLTSKRTKESYFNFASSVVISVIALEDFIQSLISKRPKAIDWAIIVELIEYMRAPMMIWLYMISV